MNFNSEVARTIEDALSRYAREGEGVVFSFGLTLVPGPTNEPTLITVVALRMKALTLGEYVKEGFFISDPFPTATEIDPQVLHTLNSLREMRTRQMQDAIGAASPNGSSPELGR